MKKLRNVEPLMAIFRFSATYDDIGIASYGIVVHNTNTFPFPKVHTDDLLYYKMGYKDVTEYMSTYPGKFAKNSKIKETYLRNVASKQFLMNNIDIQLDVIGHFKKVSDFVGLISLPKILQSLFAVPALDELTVIDGYDSVTKDKLYFCSDWNL